VYLDGLQVQTPQMNLLLLKKPKTVVKYEIQIPDFFLVTPLIMLNYYALISIRFV